MDLSALKKAVSVITMDVAAKVVEESLKVLSGLECPRHRYHESRKTFIPNEGVLQCVCVVIFLLLLLPFFFLWLMGTQKEWLSCMGLQMIKQTFLDIVLR